jgi:hypothetical protein
MPTMYIRYCAKIYPFCFIFSPASMKNNILLYLTMVDIEQQQQQQQQQPPSRWRSLLLRPV